MNFIKATVIGGIFFLVPFIIVTVVLKKAYEIVHQIAVPIKSLLPSDDFVGVNFAVAFMLVMVCFLAGIIAQRSVFAKKANQLDKVLGQNIPGYMQIKSIVGGRLGEDVSDTSSDPVLVRAPSGGVRLGFEIERDDNGLVVVFFPGVPNPQSGHAVVFPADQVEKLDIPPHQAFEMLQFHGRGLAKIVGGSTPGDVRADT